jgi:HSP20 family protein
MTRHSLGRNRENRAFAIGYDANPRNGASTVGVKFAFGTPTAISPVQAGPGHISCVLTRITIRGNAPALNRMLIMLMRTRRFSLPAFDSLTSIQRDVEHLFGQFLNEAAGANAEGDTTGWRVPLAMWDDTDKVYFEIELPGIAKENIDLTIHNGTLRVSAERAHPQAERNYRVNDRSYGLFDRVLSLPEDVDAESIDAQLTDGVLRITLSRKPEAQPKKITLRG